MLKPLASVLHGGVKRAKEFCVGDKFFLKNNMILCQTDYEEGLMKEGYAPQQTDSAEIAVVRGTLEDHWKPAAAFSFKKKDEIRNSRLEIFGSTASSRQRRQYRLVNYAFCPP
ncbi:hypothetical protein E2320_004299, partial [Naja naja]